jgi:hypothetical protein
MQEELHCSTSLVSGLATGTDERPPGGEIVSGQAREEKVDDKKSTPTIIAQLENAENEMEELKAHLSMISTHAKKRGSLCQCCQPHGEAAKATEAEHIVPLLARRQKLNEQHKRQLTRALQRARDRVEGIRLIAKSTGESVTHPLRPLIWVKSAGKGKERPMLMDSGADYTLLSEDMAQSLQIPYSRNGRKTKAKGVSGYPIILVSPSTEYKDAAGRLHQHPPLKVWARVDGTTDKHVELAISLREVRILITEDRHRSRSHNYGIIGTPTMRKWKAKINFDSRRPKVTVKVGHKPLCKHSLHTGVETPPVHKPEEGLSEADISELIQREGPQPHIFHIQTTTTPERVAREDEEKEQLLQQLLRRYNDVILQEGEGSPAPDPTLRPELNHTHAFKEGFDPSAGKRPPMRPTSRLPPERAQALDRLIRDLEKRGHITKASDPSWAHPTVLVEKGNGKYRLTCDMRFLNSVIRPASRPLPKIKDILAELGDATAYTTLDLSDAFFSVPLDPAVAKYNAIRLPDGRCYQFVGSPQGLRTSSAALQTYLDAALGQAKRLFPGRVHNYADDITIVRRKGESLEDHMKVIEGVLECLREYNLYISRHKIHLNQKTIDFLGNKLEAPGILSAAPEKLDIIRDFPTPTKVAELETFIGLSGYLRDFVPNYAEMIRPLQELQTELRRDAKLRNKGKRARKSITIKNRWDSTHTMAMEKVRETLLQCLQAYIPEPNEPSLIQTDASLVGIGACLFQWRDGQKVPCGWYSRRLSMAERNFSIYEREALAIFEATKHWAHVLRYAPIKVDIVTQAGIELEADHKPLARLLQSVHVGGMTPRQIRMAATLSPYCMSWRHIPGGDNLVADALSRLPAYTRKPVGPDPEERHIPGEEYTQIAAICCVEATPEADTTVVEQPETDLHPVTTSKKEEWHQKEKAAWATLKKAYLEDKHLKGVIEALSTKDRSPTKYDAIYRLVDDKIVFQNLRAGAERICIPKNAMTLKKFLIDQAHRRPPMTHPGRDAIYTSLTERFFWPDLMKDIQKYLKHCPECQKTRVVRRSDNTPYIKPIAITMDGKMAGRARYIHMDMFYLPLPGKKGCSHYVCEKQDFDGSPDDTDQGFKTALLIIDRATRFVMVHPLRHHTTEEVKREFLKWVQVFQPPLELITDGDPLFKSEEWKTLMVSYEIKHNMTGTSHPQADGLAERAIQTVKSYLRSLLTHDLANALEIITPAVLTYNAYPQTSIAMSPFRAMMGTDPPYPKAYRLHDDELRLWEDEEAFERHQELIFAMTRQALMASQKRMVERQKDKFPHKFSVGDMVYVHRQAIIDPRSRLARSYKYTPHWYGPTKVIATFRDSHKVELPEGMTANPWISAEWLRPAATGDREWKPYEEPGPSPDGEWYVEEVTDHKGRGARLQLYVRWKGYSDIQGTWEPLQNLIDEYGIVNEQAKQYLERKHIPIPKAYENFLRPASDAGPATRLRKAEEKTARKIKTFLRSIEGTMSTWVTKITTTKNVKPTSKTTTRTGRAVRPTRQLDL